MPEVGEHAPDFTLPGTRGLMSLEGALRQGPVVLAFYQEDGTPACQTQLAALRDDHDLLDELGARVLAISTDPLPSHEQFAASLTPPYPLLSDEDGSVARLYGVYDEESRRARRAVFVIDPDGTVQLAIPWYNPSNTSQYEQIFRALGLDPNA
jgi:thioredoxin-dependent peroxiredoxin